MIHFKIDATYTHYNATNTLCLLNAFKIKRRGPLEPFVAHAIVNTMMKKIVNLLM